MASAGAQCVFPIRSIYHPSLTSGDRTRLHSPNSPAAAAPLQCAKLERLEAWSSSNAADPSCSSALPQCRGSPHPFAGTSQRSKAANGSLQTKHCRFRSDGSFWTSDPCLGDRFPPNCSIAKFSDSRSGVAIGFGKAAVAATAGADQHPDALDASSGTSDGAAARVIPADGPDDSKSLGFSILSDLITDWKHFCSKAGVSGGLAAVLLPVLLDLWSPGAAMAIGNEAVFPNVMTFAGPEPANALSMPTWIIHVASVAEWVAAMGLVWKYGETEGHAAWKGLAWGMVPLLGGAMCACTWHFFYNAESLEFLVAIQGFLTVLGNCTMWAAAYRIWKVSQ